MFPCSLEKRKVSPIQKEMTILNLTKAFDLVNHDILICKLKHYRVRGIPLEMLNLIKRTQMTSWNSMHSNLESIKRGVLQGSKLGPILFITVIRQRFTVQY